MTETVTSTDRRAQHVALMGFIMQLAAFGTLLGLSVWASSDAIAAVARFMVIGVPVWLVLFLVFKQAQRVEAERLETAELKRAQQSGETASIFDVDDEDLLLEQNRLMWMARWLLPAVTVVLSAYLLLGHYLWWGWPLDVEQVFDEGVVRRTQQPTLMMWFVIGVGFLCFLYARYAITLARMREWHLLRAGATCMAGNALACLGLSIALMVGVTASWAEPLVALLMRIGLVVFGLEFAINFIMDFYRPRVPDQIRRPSFDSRLLGLVSEPDGIAKSIADAVNYQFGFEVSSTWFYQLLQRWLFPVVVATAVTVLLLTSVVIVDADEQAVVERFGKEPTEVWEPGLHFKLPYPIDIVYRVPARRVNELMVGEAVEEDDESLTKPVVWTEVHDYIPELMLVVASPKDEDASDDSELEAEEGEAGESVAVSLLLASVPIEYRIKDVRDYFYTYDDPVKVLEAIAYQYMSDFAASVTTEELMGPGREAFNRRLKEHIQQRLDDLDIGIEVAFTGFQGVHPPAKGGVASAYLGVVAAEVGMRSLINAAEREELKILTAVAGTKARADELDAAIREKDALRSQSKPDPQALAAAEQRVEDLLMGNVAKGIPPLSGEAAAQVAAARAEASKLISEASAKVRVFATEVAAYEASPMLYKQRKQISVYKDLDDVRKYLVIGDPSNVIVIFDTSEEGGIDRVLRKAGEDQ